jgi:hypothetical protein
VTMTREPGARPTTPAPGAGEPGAQPPQRSGGGNAQGGGSIFSKGEREPAATGAEQREGQPAGQGGGGQ